MKTKNRNQAKDSLSLPGTDIFTNVYIAMYRDKYNTDFKISLVVCLLKAFSTKKNGMVNTVYSPNIFNVHLTL